MMRVETSTVNYTVRGCRMLIQDQSGVQWLLDIHDGYLAASTASYEHEELLAVGEPNPRAFVNRRHSVTFALSTTGQFTLTLAPK